MPEPRIHPTAVVDPTAKIGDNVEIGPLCVVGAHVEIGNNTVLIAQVVLQDRTIIGEDCEISPGAVLGGPPQDLNYKDEPTRVRIGNRCRIRECVTINRATGEGKETVVGDDCFLMAYSHLAHNCQVGNNVILANTAQVGGHAQLGDYVFLGGMCVIHQHCRVGRFAFMSGLSGARQDVPPFSMNSEAPSIIRGLNTIGLRRRGFTQAQRQNLKKAFYYLWFAGLSQAQAIQAIRDNLETDEYIEELITFVTSAKRGISHSKKRVAQHAALENEPGLEPLSV